MKKNRKSIADLRGQISRKSASTDSYGLTKLPIESEIINPYPKRLMNGIKYLGSVPFSF